jgi:hypothetical protein
VIVNRPQIFKSETAFSHRTEAAGSTLNSAYTNLITAGYAATGDGGAALYKRATAEPSHTGKFQSADGAWWELAEPVVSIKMLADAQAGLQFETSLTHAAIVPIGSSTLPAGAEITAYSHILGYGDESKLVVPAGATGIAYTASTGVFDDHPHNVIRDIRITGDGTVAAYPNAQNGTTTGISFATVDDIGSLGNVEGVVMEAHDIGRHIKRSYGHIGRRNHYRANKVGLKLDTVTSFVEENIYARYNSTAAIQIIDTSDVVIRGGAIEGNPGKAIDSSNTTSTVGQLTIDGVYFESNGNQADGVWSIDVPFTDNTHVNIRSGHYWFNTLTGVSSGPYRLGPSLSMDGATINGRFYAKDVVGFRNCRGVGVGVWNTMGTEALSRTFGLTAPAVFHEFKPAAYEQTFTAAATAGLIIGTKVTGRGPLVSPDFENGADIAYPYSFVVSGSGSAVENAALDYGDGSFWQVTFGASAGDFSNNYATLETFADTTKPFRTYCCLIRPEDDFEVGFIQSVGGQSVTGYYKLLADTTYRIVIAAQAPMTGASTLRMFPLDDSAPVVNVLPIWKSQSATYVEQLQIIELLVEGSL